MPQFIKPFSKSKIKVFYSPFIYGYIDNFVPEEIYKKLEASFPDPKQSDETEVFKRGKNRIAFVAPPLSDSIPKDSPWLDFVGQITSSAYMNDCLKWIEQTYVDFVVNNNNLYTKMIMSRFDIDKKELKMQCEFSSLGTGTYLEPHTDAENKFISCIYYLPNSKWQKNWGGETECYKPKDPKYNSNWDNRHLPVNQMDILFNCEFRPNRLFFFVKAQNSWHGISPLMTPPGLQRRTFNFSIIAPHDVFRKAASSDYQKQISKQEAKIFNRGLFRSALRCFSHLLNPR